MRCVDATGALSAMALPCCNARSEGYISDSESCVSETTANTFKHCSKPDQTASFPNPSVSLTYHPRPQPSSSPIASQPSCLQPQQTPPSPNTNQHNVHLLRPHAPLRPHRHRAGRAMQRRGPDAPALRQRQHLRDGQGRGGVWQVSGGGGGGAEECYRECEEGEGGAVDGGRVAVV